MAAMDICVEVGWQGPGHFPKIFNNGNRYFVTCGGKDKTSRCAQLECKCLGLGEGISKLPNLPFATARRVMHSSQSQ